MAGQNRFAMSGAKVLVTEPDGTTASFDQMTVRYQDGLVTAKRGRVVLAEMPSTAEVEKVARRSYTITGTDGTLWTISKKGCCGNR